MSCARRGQIYRMAAVNDVIKEVLDNFTALDPIDFFSRAVFNGRPPVLVLKTIDRTYKSNNTEADDIDTVKLIEEHGLIERLEKYIGYVKITYKVSTYAITFSITFVPPQINNPEDEQVAVLPMESLAERRLEKETSW